MKLTFSPIRMPEALTAVVNGAKITLNGVALDFSPMPAGSMLPRDAIDSPWIAGDVVRDETGELTIPLILPHGVQAPQETLFPAPLTVADGPVALPLYEVENTSHVDD